MKGFREQHKDQKKKGNEINTFTVQTGAIKEDSILTTNSNYKKSKEKLINQAFKLHSQGNISEASKFYQYCIEKDFMDPIVFSNYGSILRDLGKLKEAELLTRKAIELKLSFAEAHYNLGGILKDLGKLKEAEISTRKAIEIKADYGIAYFNLGNILRDLGKLQEAELSQRKAIELQPNFADAYLNLGNILRDLGKLQEAELLTRKAIEIKPDFAEGHSNLGTILKDLGKLQEAEISTRKAIELKPDFADAHSNIGSILSNLGKLEEAEISQRKAIEVKPNFAMAHSSLGGVLLELGKLKEAEISTRKAIELEPKSAKFKLNLGVCQFALGNLNSSLETLDLAYQIDPNDKLIKALRAILKGRNKEKKKNLRVETIRDLLFEEQSNWKPLVLHRIVEEELIQKLYTIKTQEASNQDRSPRPIVGNTQGSDYDLFESEIPILRHFKGGLIKILSDYFDSEIHITESFFNIISPKDGVGGGNKIHNHLNRVDRIPEIGIANQKFSLVYYLSIGDQDCQEKGILKFHNPTKDFLPKKGMIVIFPASKLHSVAYNGTKDRVVLVVNFYLI